MLFMHIDNYRQDRNSGELYYFNFDTGASIWEHPCDDHYRDVCFILLLLLLYRYICISCSLCIFAIDAFRCFKRKRAKKQARNRQLLL